MDKKLAGFLNNHRIGVLTTLLKDGSPHSAVLHYSHSENPLIFYFSTDSGSVKCEDLLDGEEREAAVVIGLSEEEWITLQMRGKIQIISKEERLGVQENHYEKHPGSAKYAEVPTTIFLRFIPTWWRYTDFNTKPVTTLSSETI